MSYSRWTPGCCCGECKMTSGRYDLGKTTRKNWESSDEGLCTPSAGEVQVSGFPVLPAPFGTAGVTYDKFYDAVTEKYGVYRADPNVGRWLDNALHSFNYENTVSNAQVDYTKMWSIKWDVRVRLITLGVAIPKTIPAEGMINFFIPYLCKHKGYKNIEVDAVIGNNLNYTGINRWIYDKNHFIYTSDYPAESYGTVTPAKDTLSLDPSGYELTCTIDNGWCVNSRISCDGFTDEVTFETIVSETDYNGLIYWSCLR